MKRLPKILLGLSVAGFAFSLTSFGSAIHYGMLKPVSAIFFILFFIVHVLDKEIVKFDVENEANIARCKRGPLLKSNDLANSDGANKRRLAIAH